MRHTELIFDGAHLRAVLHPGHSGLLVVTLDYRSTGKTDFSADAHSTSFARMGHAQLTLKSTANDWFINADTPAFEAALANVAARYDRVHMLGYSMGGYGAFRFAAALRATSIVAVSPQVSIHPRTVPFDRRYRVEAAGFDPVLGDLALRPWPTLQGLMVIDPFIAPDRRHAMMLQALYPGVRIVRLGFGGHPATQVLRHAGKSWTVQREAAAAAASTKLILKSHRSGRRQSAGYWLRLAKRAQQARPGLAQYALDRAKALGAQIPGQGTERDTAG